MSKEQSEDSLNEQKEKYVYVVKGTKENVALDVDSRDVILNADGDIDCPLDVVLRKNNFTFNHLNEWDAREINFLRVANGESITLRKISLNMNL